jgi:two-component system, sensor histidine kinase and response regulator
MPQSRNFIGWSLIGALLSLVLPLLGTAIAGMVFADLRWIQLPFHAILEGCGGIVALAVAGILLYEIGHKQDTKHYLLMAMGLVSMGVLDIFHGATIPGNYFVWLHSVATFSGGLFFALLWGADRLPSSFFTPRYTVGVTIMAVVVGICSVLNPDSLPAMRTSSGRFSNAAFALNLLGGLGFFLASTFFIRRFYKLRMLEDWVFAVQTSFFGAAGVLFGYSILWDAGWWWWHMLRLAAYVATLFYGLRTYRDAESELRQVNSQLRDMNFTLDRTVAERTVKLQAIEERLNLALKSSCVGTWSWDIVQNKIIWDDFIHPLFGLTPGTFSGRYEDFLVTLHVDDRERVQQEVARAVEQDATYDTEYKVVWPDGSVHVLGSRGKVYRDPNGSPQRMTGVCWDITERKRLEDRFRLAVEASPVALMMIRKDGGIILANSSCLKMFGYTLAEMVGQPVNLVVPSRFLADLPKHLNKYFDNPVQRAMGAELDLLGVRKDGTEFPVKVGLSPVLTDEGQLVICGLSDITDQKRMMEVMRQAKESAESASRAKSSFLANMSHEIRTPMNGIIGMAQLLAQTELREHQREYLATMDESAHILLRLLNDILDFSKIEAGKLELEKVDFSISECVARASQMMALRIAEKGLEFACRVAPEIPDRLRGDAGRLQQILVNLLGNAVKFTEVGEIFVNVNAESMSAGSIQLHVSVSDTGIGIPDEKRDQIFRPFEQAESSTTRRFGGTGLGLAISRQLVEMMNGRIWLESESGRGSVFHFTAELEIAADQHSQALSDLKSLHNLPVLVVDDNATNRRILAELLQHWNLQPVMADSAAAARKVLKEAEASACPIRLILLDHHMPVEDGIHFATSLSGTITATTCPIIMISSGSQPIDIDLGQQYGIVRFMTKPVIASELLNEVLRQFGGYQNISEKHLPAETPQLVHPRRLLLVEDNVINRRVAMGLLKARGHQAVVAENGQEAVDTLATQAFDVVLMDMQMPVMDGYEAIAELRQREHRTGGHIPIVAMTAEALKGDRERCLACGADDYVSKPINPVELYRAIEQFPARCLPAQLADQQLEADDCQSQHLSSLASSSSQQATVASSQADTAVDWNVARKHLGDSPQVLREFCELVKTQVSTLVADMRSAIESRDAKLLQRSAHTLKSSVKYFGAESLAQAALAIETLGRTASSASTPELFADAHDLLSQLEPELVRVVAELTAGPRA